MKAGKRAKYPSQRASPSKLKEGPAATESRAEAMIRTQIYLSKEEHNFISAEARRLDKPMSAVIRSFIDEKMQIPEEAWIDNPMLRPFPPDPTWKSPSDGAINHDHYLYGCPKKWIKVKSKWVEAPPLPDDYYDNPASAKAYDEMLRKLDETK
jgi:hypothetical protein